LIESLVPAGLFTNATTRCFATITREAKFIDPGEPRDVSKTFFARLRPSWAYVAHHVDLGQVEREANLGTVHLMFSLTSALPYIFSSVRVGKGWAFDGGLADNVPIDPLVTRCRCHRIFVLHLNDGKSSRLLGSESLSARLVRLDHLRRLEKVVFNGSAKPDGVASERIEEQVKALWASWYVTDAQIIDDIKHCEIIHLFPSEHLGNFVTGTLNFTGKKASWLIALGEADMKHLLDKVGV